MSNKKENISSNQNSSGTVLKAGIWYTISNFLFRGIGFITTPIFSRVLSKSELGMFTNFTSWLSILALITGLELQMTVIRSKLEIKEDMDSYILSMATINTVFTAILYFVYLLFPNFFNTFLQIDPKFMPIIFMYLLLTPSFQLIVTKQRAFYKYKSFTLITGVMTLVSVIFSLILTLIMNDKLAGRIFGLYVPQIVTSLVCYIYIIYIGKRINLDYIKTALIIAVPLVPHSLSLYLLSSSDKIMITKFSGPEITAVYSIAYSAYHILTIIFDSMNKAWAPWLLDSLHLKNYKEIKKTSKIYVLIFSSLAIMVTLLIPEIILILGGEKYIDAIYAMPPLIISVLLQLIYTIFVNVEFFLRKSVVIARSTIIAAGINIVLNLIFIPMSPENGYMIASYTTMIGYFILLLMHYRTIKSLHMFFMFDMKFFNVLLLIFFIIAMSMNILFKYYVLRYILTVIYIGLLIYILIKYKDKLLKIIRKQK